ncbi:MAG: GNAT family N-acetyltransferase [Actinomycetota bacterium]
MRDASITIAAALGRDLEAINEIYNHYVRTTAITFDLEPRSMAWRRAWFRENGEDGPYRLFVARGAAEVIGYASSSSHRPRGAYVTSVETSVYLAPGHIGRGVGTELYRRLLLELEDEDVHRAYAGITMPNPASVRLHDRLGFRRVGTFTEQGRKFGRYWDVAWYERPVP